MYIVKEMWHGRSARDQSPKDVGRGMWRSVNELILIRYTLLGSPFFLLFKDLKHGIEHDCNPLSSSFIYLLHFWINKIL